MSKVNFIDEFNVFMRYARSNQLTGRERLLWTALFTIANDRATYNAQTKEFEWPSGFFPIPNAELSLNSTLDKRGIETVRNSLKQKGLIDFHPGSRNKKPPEYQILYLSLGVGSKIVPNDTPKTAPNNDPNSTPNDDPNPDSKQGNFGYKNAPLSSNKSSGVGSAFPQSYENDFCGGNGSGGSAAAQIEAMMFGTGNRSHWEGLSEPVRREIVEIVDDLFSLYGTRATAPMDYIYASGWLSGAIEADISTGTPSTRLRKDQEIQSMQIAFESAFGANRGCQWNYINGALRNMKMAALTGADDEE